LYALRIAPMHLSCPAHPIIYFSGIQPFCSRTPRYNFSSNLYPPPKIVGA
jgi:hypothetical protein